MACDPCNVIFVVYGPLGSCNSTKAEMVGLLEGLCILNELGIQGCEVKGDSTVISWGRDRCEGRWQLTYLV